MTRAAARVIALAAARAIALALLGLALAGCSAGRRNPSFDLSSSEARAELHTMAGHLVPLERPVVVVGGFADPGIAASGLARDLRRHVANPELVLAVAFFSEPSFEACRARLLERIADAWPGEESGASVEVDVVGISMGGLVARYAACSPLDGSRRLRMARLFTISTPHRGATMAALPSFDRKVRDMRSGSAFLSLLDAAETDYPIVAYTRLDDAIVGETNAAPPDHTPWWVPPPPLQASHLYASNDPRIIADILRRLRGEFPLTTEPAAPLP